MKIAVGILHGLSGIFLEAWRSLEQLSMAVSYGLRPLGIQPPLHRRRMDFFRKSFAFALDEAFELGFKPRVPLDEGMRATARWYRERGLIAQESER